MTHLCPDCGLEHEGAPPAPEPAPVIVEPGPNDNDVKIAEIEAEARVATEQLWTEQRGLELAGEVESLRGELRGMREVLDRLAPPEPESDPAPVVIPAAVPDSPAPPAEPAAAPPEGGPPKAEKKSSGYWG